RLFEFSVRDVVLMGRHAYSNGSSAKASEDHDKAARAMVETDTIHLADRSITALSGGEHRRVLVARALCQSARTLLLDEPTSHLDIGHQADLVSICRRKVDVEGVAVLAALHDLNVAAEFCDRIILLHEGVVVVDGQPASALSGELISRVYGAGVTVTTRPGS